MAAMAQATFIAFLLFFWLLIVHSISLSDHIHIDEQRFYMPKIVLCGAIWFVLVLSLSYVHFKESDDPTFYWQNEQETFYTTIQIIFGVMLLLYSSYFVIVGYLALF